MVSFMGIFSGFLFGVLGWTLSGPIGAIIGGILGYNLASPKEIDDYDKAARPDYGDLTGDGDRGPSRRRASKKDTAQGDFGVALMMLVAAVMRADGRVTKDELSEVKEFLAANFPEDQAKAALQVLKEVLKRDFEIAPVCAQIRDNLNYSSRLELLHLLFKISAADGMLTKSEMDLVRDIAYRLGINAADFRSIYAAYSAYTRGSSSSGGSSQGGAQASRMSLSQAYSILELTPEATEQDVKKAYRKMAMKFHPDKVNTLGEEVKRSAAEKFKAVNEAYNVIKDAKGYK